MSTYILAVGEPGRERLELVDHLYGPYSHQFLKKLPLQPGMTVADVGCGIGTMSTWFAKAVGSAGQVTAIDSSEAQLSIAKEKARNQNLTNIEFIQSSIFELPKIKCFDLVYCRFLLIHLPQAKQACEIMFNLVKENGFLICEEYTLSHCRSQPESIVFNQAMKLMIDLGQRSGSNFDMGMHLSQLLSNVSPVYIETSHPIITEKKEKRLLEMGLRERAPALVAAKMITKTELDQLLMDLRRYTDQSEVMIYYYPLTHAKWMRSSSD